jgi:hypothetical protein
VESLGPLLEGEDSAAYDELATRVFSAVEPTDFIEEIWARDLADVSWNLLRLTWCSQQQRPKNISGPFLRLRVAY